MPSQIDANTSPGFRSGAGIGQRTHVEALLEIVGDVRDLDITDLGCGDGGLARTLATKGARAVGVDPLVASAQEAKLGNGTFRVLQGCAEAIPLPTGSADLVTFVFSLHHVGRTALTASLREARRLLRRSGRLYVAEPLSEGPLQYLLMPFHDETEVRANAINALAKYAEPEFGAMQTFRYTERRSFPNFQAFAAKMTAKMRYNEYDPHDVSKPEVVRRFDELFARYHGNVDQPVMVNVYSDPKAST